MDGALVETASRAPSFDLAAATDTGTLGIYRLKRYWSRTMLARQGRPVRVSRRERHLDYLVIHASGLGLEQTAHFLGHNAPSFAEFERWIVATTGGIDPLGVARINAAVSGSEYPDEIKHWLAAVEAMAPVFSPDH